jgi:DNA polymerase/3'-5' exonuclease PolX
MPVQNAEIADMFDQTAELLEIKGDNPFRSRAYRNAARVIERLPKSVTSLVKAGEDLSELPGIGKDLAGKIATIVATQHFDVLDKLKRELPGDLGDARDGIRCTRGFHWAQSAGVHVGARSLGLAKRCKWLEHENLIGFGRCDGEFVHRATTCTVQKLGQCRARPSTCRTRAPLPCC